MVTAGTPATAVETATFEDRRKTADRVFRGALIFNSSLTVFWLVVLMTGGSAFVFQEYRITREGLAQIFGGVVFIYIIWGFIWYGIKTALLKYVVGFSKEDRRRAFSSRMNAPYDVVDLLQCYSERRIRIVDMIGRRGRFITLGMTGFFYLYASIEADPTPDFATKFLGNNLFDAVVTSWILLGLYYADGFLAAAFFGPQSRVMDGVLARANCLLITTLWTVFKFVLVPIGAKLATIFSREEFAVVFALIRGVLHGQRHARRSGRLDPRQTADSRLGHRGRQPEVDCRSRVGLYRRPRLLSLGRARPPAGLSMDWPGNRIAVSTTALELWSPRGTDDFTMATANALICLAFGLYFR